MKFTVFIFYLKDNKADSFFIVPRGNLLEIELRFERIVPWVGEAEAPYDWATRCRF